MIPLEAEWRVYRRNRDRRPILTLIKGGLTVRNANELPPAEDKERPEDPFSHDWERVWEPTHVPPPGEHRRSITYVSTPRIPETDLQALMESAPFGEPSTSMESGALLRERLDAAIEVLPERLKWIFEARHYRGLSIRQVGAELNLAKSHVERLYRQAVNLLRADLTDVSDWLD